MKVMLKGEKIYCKKIKLEDIKLNKNVSIDASFFFINYFFLIHISRNDIMELRKRAVLIFLNIKL